MYKDIWEKLKCMEDQPIRVYTDDERVITGYVLGVSEDFVRVLDKCGDTFLIEKDHIASIEEPHMRLERRCACRRLCDRDGDGSWESDAEFEYEDDNGGRYKKGNR